MVFEEFCKALGAHWRAKEPMRRHTTFRIGGDADLAILAPVDLTCPEESAAAKILREALHRGEKVWILGKGSNLLVDDAGLPGTVLRLSGEGHPYLTPEGLLRCGGGISLTSLCLFAEKNGLSGLEFAYGIPASLGGALYMNAGAYGGEIGDVAVYVDVLTREGKYVRLTGSELGYAYRHSVFMEEEWNGCLIVGGAFRLVSGDKQAIRRRMEEHMASRKEKQPLAYPSAGSAFKRPPGAFAAALIDQCGLKGLRWGDAQVSEKHAGFIVNLGKASSGDVMALMEQVRQTVREKTGVLLTPEICFWS